MVPAKAASALTDFTSPLTKGEFQSLLEKIVGSFEQETGRLDVTQSRAQCPDMSSVLACCASAICCVLCAEHDNIYKPRYRADVPKLERFRTVICCGTCRALVFPGIKVQYLVPAFMNEKKV